MLYIMKLLLLPESASFQHPLVHSMMKSRLTQFSRHDVLNLVEGVKYFACTTDMWTSRAQHAYMSLTVHYIDKDLFSLQSHLVETKEFPNSHTGVNVAEGLQGILQDWGLFF